jgi:RNA polymerase sigma-70 factor, ECF subfamily
MNTAPAAQQPLPAWSEDALRALYRDHAGALLAYAEHFTHDRMAAEDALQETFLRAWRHLPRLLQDDRPPRPWLRQVLRRILIDRARAAQHRHTSLVDDAVLDGETESGYDTLLDRQLLAGAMEQLSRPHRDVLVETYYLDLPADCVAAALGVPVGTVRSRLHYALQALRRQLTEVRDGTSPVPTRAAEPPVTARQLSSRPGRRSPLPAAVGAPIS